MQNTTIAALSTPAGVGGIGVVRLSGPNAIKIAGRVFRPNAKGKSLEAQAGYTGLLGRIYGPEGDVDDAIAFVYRAPKSYTGEEVVELSCHGGLWVVRQLLRLCFDAGAMPAAPGEFTRRAYQNGKLSLDQAEAVANIITAQSGAALRAALAGRDGALTGEINRFIETLKGESAHLAAWADFPEEDLVPVNPAELAETLLALSGCMERLLAGWDAGKVLREGLSVAIIGKPNVGKSTLLNLLTGEDTSIVTDIPGTTRDVVRESAKVGDFVLRLADTAGIRDTADPIESIGVARSRRQLETCDLVFAVFDSSDPLTPQDAELMHAAAAKPCIAVLNKSDLPSKIDREHIEKHIPAVVALSARTGEGLAQLEQAIARVLSLSEINPAAPMLASERQRSCLAAAAAAVAEARGALAGGQTLDIVNVLIDAALDELLSLTGERAADVVVDEVFARFCVGK